MPQAPQAGESKLGALLAQRVVEVALQNPRRTWTHELLVHAPWRVHFTTAMARNVQCGRCGAMNPAMGAIARAHSSNIWQQLSGLGFEQAHMATEGR